MKKEETKGNAAGGFETATGEVPFPLSNDYLFKVLMQKDERVLRSIISAVLLMKEEEIESVHIENPIIPGEKVDDKDVVLDVRVTMNKGVIIDLEMQVVNHHNWTSRSTYYAARNLANLQKGDEYVDVMPVYQIGFLDFHPFNETQAFRSENRLMDTKTHRLYTDLITIITVVMPQNDIASPEDKEYNLDGWVRLFKARTWEEARKMAENNTALYEAAETMYNISEDQRIRDQLEAREDRLRIERYYKRHFAEFEKQNEENRQQIEKLQYENAELRAKLAELEEKKQ